MKITLLEAIKLIVSIFFKILIEKILYSIKEAYKYKFKSEKYKDDNTIKFGAMLVENGKINEGIDFVKSERKEDRKQGNIRYYIFIFVVIVFLASLFAFVAYLIKK